MLWLNHLTVQLLADGVPTIHANGNYPAHETVNKIAGWILAIIILGCVVNIVYQIFQLRDAGEGGVVRRPAISIIVSLVLVSLLITGGTSFINNWAGLFG